MYLLSVSSRLLISSLTSFSIAIFLVSILPMLYKRGTLKEYLDDKEKWATIYKEPDAEQESEQLRFDFGS